MVRYIPVDVRDANGCIACAREDPLVKINPASPQKIKEDKKKKKREERKKVEIIHYTPYIYTRVVRV